MSERRTGYLRRILGLWIAVTLCVIIAISPILAPPPPSGDEPDAISVDSALEHVEFISQEPHVMGTPESGRVREYLIASLVEAGFDPETLTIEAPDYFGESGGTVNVTDVFVRIPASTVGYLFVWPAIAAGVAGVMTVRSPRYVVRMAAVVMVSVTTFVVLVPAVDIFFQFASPRPGNRGSEMPTVIIVPSLLAFLIVGLVATCVSEPAELILADRPTQVATATGLGS